MKNIVALISGRGSNMQAIVQAARSEGWPAQISTVISNDPQAGGLAWARQQGIATQVVAHRDYAQREQFDEALLRAIDAVQPDLILLAGFMRVLGGEFVHRFAGRLLNIHPSLLPSFKGLHTHARALAAGVKVHGATVHLVSPELDSGAILAQAALPVLADDTEASLAAAVLQAEHRLYPMVVGWIVRGEMRCSASGYQWADRSTAQAFSADRQIGAGRTPKPQWLWMARDADLAATTKVT